MMMIRVLSESNPIASKEFNCDACDFILNSGISGFGYSFAELRLIAKAKKNGFKIVIGQQYLKQNNVCGDELYTFRAIPEMHDICLNHDLYTDW